MRMTSLIGYVRERPVLGLGRGGLWVGGLMVFAAVVSIAARLAAPVQSVSSSPPAWLPAPLVLMDEHYVILNQFQISLGLLVSLSGLFILKRRPWARALLEALTWVGLIITLAYAWMLGRSWDTSNESGGNTVASFLILGSAVWAVVLVVFIRFLRSQRVRGAF